MKREENRIRKGRDLEEERMEVGRKRQEERIRIEVDVVKGGGE